MTPSAKKQLNVRLSNEGHRLLAKLCKHHGLSQSGVVEMLLRKEARAQKLKGGRS